MKPHLLLLAALVACGRPDDTSVASKPATVVAAPADTSVESYLRLRRAAVAASDAHLFDGKPLDPAFTDEKATVADLERRLRAMIGPVDVPGYPQPGRINLEGLCDREVDCGLLDGIVYRDSSGANALVVTTRPILEGWLDDRKYRVGDPARVDSALASPDLLAAMLGGDAAIYPYSGLPIPAADSAGLHTAMLILRAQDYGPFPPREVIVTFTRGARIYLAQQGAAVPIPESQVCRSRADSAFKAEHDAGRTSQQITLNGIGEAIYEKYRRCYGERPSDIPGFDKLVEQVVTVLHSAKP